MFHCPKGSAAYSATLGALQLRPRFQMSTPPCRSPTSRERFFCSQCSRGFRSPCSSGRGLFCWPSPGEDPASTEAILQQSSPPAFSVANLIGPPHTRLHSIQGALKTHSLQILVLCKYGSDSQIERSLLTFPIWQGEMNKGSLHRLHLYTSTKPRAIAPIPWACLPCAL